MIINLFSAHQENGDTKGLFWVFMYRHFSLIRTLFVPQDIVRITESTGLLNQFAWEF